MGDTTDPAMRGASPLDPDPEQRAASRAFMRHVRDCAPCKTNGVDCPDAAELRTVWREAKTAARAARAVV